MTYEFNPHPSQAKRSAGPSRSATHSRCHLHPTRRYARTSTRCHAVLRRSGCGRSARRRAGWGIAGVRWPGWLDRVSMLGVTVDGDVVLPGKGHDRATPMSGRATTCPRQGRFSRITADRTLTQCPAWLRARRHLRPGSGNPPSSRQGGSWNAAHARLDGACEWAPVLAGNGRTAARAANDRQPSSAVPCGAPRSR